MTSRFKRKRRRSGEQFVPIPYRMAESAAWRSLSGPAVKVYIELRRRYNGGNNGMMSLSLDEGARLLGIGKATADRALKELQEKGFITMRERGHWYGRRATTWIVADRPYGAAPPTNHWRNWQPTARQKQSLGSLSEPWAS